MQSNPILEQENFFEEYQKKIEALKNNPDVIEFDKLTYEIFERTEQGRKWIEIVRERYLIPGIARPGTPNYKTDVIWWDGFKEFARTILTCVRAHEQRIKTGEKNDRK